MVAKAAANSKLLNEKRKRGEMGLLEGAVEAVAEVKKTLEALAFTVLARKRWIIYWLTSI